MVMARSIACLASSINTQHLRSQLDQLHLESDRTRAKANNARLRIVRLSEAAEKLRRQAAVYAKCGNETGARELLFQKKKILLATEKSKNRIKLLEELAAKLNEVISIKEEQLMGKICSDLEFGNIHQDLPEPVDSIDSSMSNLNGDQSSGLQVNSTGRTDTSALFEAGLTELDNMSRCDKNEIPLGLQSISSYSEFLDHLDWQFNEIESELDTALRLSKLMIKKGEMADNSKVHLSVEILENVRAIRDRIKNFKEEVQR